MKKWILVTVVFFITHLLCAQNEKIDSLKKELVTAKDTVRVSVLNELSSKYLQISSYTEVDSNLITACRYAGDALELSRKINYRKGIGMSLFNSACASDRSPITNKQIPLTKYEEALPFLKQSGDQHITIVCMQGIAEAAHMVGKLPYAIACFDTVTQMTQQVGDTGWSVYSIMMKGHCYFDMGNYRDAYEFGVAALDMAKRGTDTNGICTALAHLANLYLGAGLPKTTLEYMHKIIAYYPSLITNKDNLPWPLEWGMIRGGEAFLELNQLDSGIEISKRISIENPDGDKALFFGHLFTAQHQYDKALVYFLNAFRGEYQLGHQIGAARHANEVGRTYFLLHDFNPAIQYAEKALQIGHNIHALLEMKNAVTTLKDIYTQTKNYKQVYFYNQLYNSLSDSLASEEYRRTLSLLEIQTQLDHQKQQALLLGKENEIKQQQLSKESLVKKFYIVGIIGLLIISAIIMRNNKHKQKANLLLQKQKSEIEATLVELKSTQSQLIQSEKMASLGELTAGIAHEIQNPLNFVNNFSDINKELISELVDEVDKGNTEEVKAIAKDISDNEEKISHHGKRADAIVKGMLQHSRSSTGVKEPTDINALADEYLRLAYHGSRAKDNAFNTTMKTDFDKSIGKINIIPQDVGRVLLNLYNNAFYAVSEKKKSAGADYEPIVTVSTKKINAEISIAVSDNGNGIPQKIVDKIFQPFFTTKPTGQGTGLGLSLSYDIIKAHGGEIKVNSNEGEGSRFIIELQ